MFAFIDIRGTNPGIIYPSRMILDESVKARTPDAIPIIVAVFYAKPSL